MSNEKIRKIMGNKSEKKIYNLITISPIVILTTLSILFLVMFYNHETNRFNNEMNQIETDYYNKQKNIVKDETKRVIKIIKMAKKLFNDLGLTEQESKQYILKNISQIRYGTHGYFFIYDYNGMNLMHPIKLHLVGKNLYNLQDINGVLLIQELISSAKNNGKYVNYVWDHPKTKKPEDKIGYALGIQDWQWMIGTGVYSNDIQDTIVLKLKEKEKKLRNTIFDIFIIVISIIALVSFFSYLFLNKIKNIILQYNNKIEHHNDNLEIEVDKQTLELKELNKNLELKVNSRTRDLKEQKKTFEAIYNGSKDAIGILDMESNFLAVNPAYIEMTGFTQDELLSTSCYTVPEDLEISKNAVQEVLQVGFIKNFEKDCIVKDNKIISTNMSMSLLNSPDRILISVRDITKQKQLNYTLSVAKQKAEENTKSKSQFLANMSHEIRTPMNGMLGMLHLALKTKLTNKQKNYIEKIDDSAKSLLNIINDILDFSKIEAGKLEINKVNFRFKDMIQNVSNIVKYKADEKALNFEINYDENISYLYGDSLRISQILLNLINNAIKFTNTGHVKVNIINSDEKFTFEIIDSGIGISYDNQTKLFQLFSQADGSTTRKYGGTGLGLSISKQLVELMDGKIWVESIENKGSKFSFEIDLPKGDGDSIEDDELFDIDQITTLKGSKILLAEDSLINQEVTAELLESGGIEIDIANNGEKAVQIFESNQNKYELILMDLQMPIMDGYSAAQIIRQIDNEIPIIALTANAMKEDIERTKTVGMNEHLNKPIDVEKLYSTLLKYISTKCEKDENNLLEDTNKRAVEADYNEAIENELANLRYINIEKALLRLRGNQDLLIKLLITFKKQKYHTAEKISAAVLQQDWSLAKELIHNLKGESGTIEAAILHESSMALENYLPHCQQDPFDNKQREHDLFFKQGLEQLLEKLTQNLDRVIADISKVETLSKQNLEQGLLPKEHHTDLDTEHLIKQLSEIDQFLKQNNLRAKKLAGKLNSIFTSSPYALYWNKFFQAIAELDFELAQKRLSVLIAQIDKSNS